MNLKKTFFSVLGAAAIVGSMFAPVSAQDDPNGTSSVTVNEDGEFSGLGIWSDGIVFPAVDVTTEQGASTSNSTGIGFLESRASASAGKIQIEATSLVVEGTDYEISVDNLSILFWQWYGWVAPVDCPAQAVEGNPSNPFQTIDNLVTTQTSFVAGSAITLLDMSAGRGCGKLDPLYFMYLNVPAGTYTGGEAAVYEGDLTVSYVVAP